MGIRIITDSTSEISQEEAISLRIDVVPLRSMFGEESFLDGIEISPSEFYARLAQAKELPTTSQPNPADFIEVFRRALDDGDEVIVICMARLLSGTCQSAEIARDACGGGGVFIVDSCTATVSLQLLVRRAIGMRDDGESAEVIVHTLESEKHQVHLLAAIDTLEYLQKGGRLSKTSTITGTLLNVKPLISLHDSVISVVGKSLGMRKAYDAVFKKVLALGGIDYDKPFAIGHTGERDRFGPFEERCHRFFADTGGSEAAKAGAQSVGAMDDVSHGLVTVQVGSVVGTHAGPGAVAVAFFRND